MAPSGLGGLRSALTPVDSCARAHLTTVVLRQLGLRHGPRRWGSKSCLRRSQIVSFDLWLRDSKLEDSRPIKRERADEATIFAWCGQSVPGPCGALR